MLRIESIKKVFEKNTINEKIALNNVSLTLEDGDFVSVIGSNGAGKSTLLNAIAGVFSVDEGKIFIDDVDVTNMPEYKRANYIGRVFQDPLVGTAADMWIEENLALASRRGKKRGLRQGITNEERKQYYEILKSFDLGLEERLTAKVGLLSGGQRQALTLFMATMNSPRLLLLDEHTAALDPKTASKVLDITNRVVKQNHLTTFMVTHNMKDALKYGNILIMMNSGKIVFTASGKEKENLTVDDLLHKFEQINGIIDDKIVLG